MFVGQLTALNSVDCVAGSPITWQYTAVAQVDLRRPPAFRGAAVVFQVPRMPGPKEEVSRAMTEPDLNCHLVMQRPLEALRMLCSTSRFLWVRAYVSTAKP